MRSARFLERVGNAKLFPNPPLTRTFHVNPQRRFSRPTERTSEEREALQAREHLTENVWKYLAHYAEGDVMKLIFGKASDN